MDKSGRKVIQEAVERRRDEGQKSDEGDAGPSDATGAKHAEKNKRADDVELHVH